VRTRHAWAPLLLCSALLLASVAGCRDEREVELLVIESVEPQVLEPGTQLRIVGRGMPAGLPGELRLSGTLARPGALPSAVSVRVPIVPDTTAEARVPAETLLAQLGGQGSFEGRLQLAFDARRGDAELTGARAVAFDVLDPLAGGVAAQHALRNAGAGLLERAGVAPRVDVATHDGLVIGDVRAGSLAAELGLRRGDVIARASSVRVHSIADLAPPVLATSVEWSVQRAGMPRPLAVRVPVKLEHAPTRLPIGRLAFLLAWAATAALVLLPRTPLWVRLARLRARVAAAPPSTLGLWGVPRSACRTRLQRSGPFLATLCGALLVCFEPASLLSVRSLSLYLPLVAVGVALALMQEGVPRSQRLHDAARQLGRMTVMGVVLSCACALSGTRALDGIVATQGAWPWQWGVLHNPALLAAFPLYVVSAAQIGESSAAKGGKRPGLFGSLVIGENVLTNVVLCALAAAIFFGGWQSPELLQLGPWPLRWPGALLFVGKSWGMALLLTRARQIELGYRRPARLWLAWCVAISAVTTAYVLMQPPALLSVLHGRAASLTCVVLGLVMLVQWRAHARRIVASPAAASTLSIVR
jgi:hypothetical protein